MTNQSKTPLVEMKNISISFGGIKAVDNVSVDLHPGEVVGLLGHNGAGKSTLIKVLSGAYSKDAGEIFINGKKVNEIPGPFHGSAELHTASSSIGGWYWNKTLETFQGLIDEVRSTWQFYRDRRPDAYDEIVEP